MQDQDQDQDFTAHRISQYIQHCEMEEETVDAALERATGQIPGMPDHISWDTGRMEKVAWKGMLPSVGFFLLKRDLFMQLEYGKYCGDA
jgi:hypothetical protein